MRIEIITGRFEALQDVDDPADLLLRMLARSTRANGRALRYVSAEEQTIFNDMQLGRLHSELALLDRAVESPEEFRFLGQLLSLCLIARSGAKMIRFVPALLRSPDGVSPEHGRQTQSPISGTAVIAEADLGRQPCVVVDQLLDDMNVRGSALWNTPISEDEFPVLAQIDPYRDTYFNRKQMPDFLGEWDRFFLARKEPGVLAEVAMVRSFAEKVLLGKGLYLKFEGD